MASTLIRIVLNDDSGTPANPVGDGSTLDNAWLQTVNDSIDAMFSGPLVLGGNLTLEGGNLSVVGMLNISGFGEHAITASGAGVNRLTIRNTSAGTTNAARFDIGNDLAANAGILMHTSSTFTAAGATPQNGLLVQGGQTGGLVLSAAAGPLKVFRGAIERLTVQQDGIRVGSDVTYTATQTLQLHATNDPTLVFADAIDGAGAAWSAIRGTRDGVGGYDSRLQFLTRAGAASAQFVGTVVGEFDSAGRFHATAGLIGSGIGTQPGFLAFNSADDTLPGDNTTCEFNSEIYDETGNFASNTFTAPVTGRYLFATSVRVQNDSGFDQPYELRLVTSLRTYLLASETTSDLAFISLTGSVVADMSAGHTATIQIITGVSGFIVKGGSAPLLTFFSGRLLV